MSIISGFPSLPPPTYKPGKLVTLLDCKGLALREDEHKKWMVESQASSHPVPIGMRPMDLEDDLGMDLDEDEASFEASFDESGQDGERSMPESESVPAEEDEAWHLLEPTNDDDDDDEARNDLSVQSEEY